MHDEGFIKFEYEWTEEPPRGWHKLRALSEWRQLMFDVGLIGAYDGEIGYGNISIRDNPPSQFIITGASTGVIRKLGPEHFTRVTDFDIDGNRLRCRGPIRASSESLTHAALYTASRSINAVIHIHNAELWHRYRHKLPTTSDDVSYGSPGMAREVMRLVRDADRPAKQLVIMGGHEEGVLAYGDSLGHAASTLLNCCDRIFKHQRADVSLTR